MPVSIAHAKSLSHADLTGTITVNNSSGGTQTAMATDLMRPGDWNSAHAPVSTGAWRSSGGLWDWLLEVKPRRKKKAEEPKRKKVERIVAEAVAEAIADSLDDDLADIERQVERAIADTRQGVEIAKRELFEQWLQREVARQRAEVLARRQLAMVEQQTEALVAQQAMEQAAARRARRLRRIALFLSVSD